MNKIIIVPSGARKLIAEELNVCYVTVARALKGKISTPVHIEIRELALKKFGGKFLEA